MDENPYQAPAEACDQAPATEEDVQPVGRAGGGRFLAAQIDLAFGVVLFLGVGMNSVESIGNIAAGIAALATYLGYYFVPEWLLGTTIGKSVFSLRVRQITGEPCTARQIAVRTITRLIEVNPFLLGAIPAGIAILSTERRQRIGDLWAGTVVVGASPRSNQVAPSVTIRVRRRT